VQKIDGELVTTTIEKNGPVVFMVTTTRDKLNSENETRMLSLEVNDSEEQTRAVLDKVAEVIGLNKEPVGADLRAFHDYQRWLAAGECEVEVPFARTLSQLMKTTRPVRLRRDFTQLLLAIKAHALLHRARRNQTSTGSIVATIDNDYAPVRELMAEPMATASELKLRDAIKETVQVVQMIATRATADEGARVREIADELGLDRTVTWRRLKAAEDAGLIVNLEIVKGRAGRYRGTGEDARQDGELLPNVRQLMLEYEADQQGPAATAVLSPGNPAKVQRQG
jgi:hypothetical protein